MRFSKVAHAQLFLSTPNPSWFGNGANAPRAVGWDAENWLTSRFHFSFAEWNDAKRAQYGCLRVLNDDRVCAPGHAAPRACVASAAARAHRPLVTFAARVARAASQLAASARTATPTWRS